MRNVVNVVKMWSIKLLVTSLATSCQFRLPKMSFLDCFAKPSPTPIHMNY